MATSRKFIAPPNLPKTLDLTTERRDIAIQEATDAVRTIQKGPRLALLTGDNGQGYTFANAVTLSVLHGQGEAPKAVQAVVAPGIAGSFAPVMTNASTNPELELRLTPAGSGTCYLLLVFS